MTQEERKVFEQIEDLAVKLRQAKTPRESLKISQELLAVSASLEPTQKQATEDHPRPKKRPAAQF